MSWSALWVMVAGAYGFKLLGVLGLARAADRPGRFAEMIALIPTALIAAIIVVQTFELDGALRVDARLAGLSAAAIAASRRAPLLVVVSVAMAVTAVVRAWS